MIEPDAVSDMFRRELLQLLKELSYEEREVTLSSGRKSNFYIDCKQTTLTARGHFLTGWLMLKKLNDDINGPVDAVGGLTMGADPIVSAISTLSVIGNALPGMSTGVPGVPGVPAIPGFYVRKEPKKHGTSQWIEGAESLKPNMRVAIIEDVITTGSSAIKAIKAAREFGFVVDRVIALVDRQEDHGYQNLVHEVKLDGLSDTGSPRVTSLFKQSDFRSPPNP